MTRKLILSIALVLSITSFATRAAEHYVIDTEGMHAFITFKIKHIGFSWLQGRFDKFSGEFDYDENNPANNQVKVEIDVTSLDTNNPLRDKHLRDERFFDTNNFPKASFVSTAWEDHGDGKATLSGDFTLRGITKNIKIEVNQVGAGKDPWGGYRRGFEGMTTLHLSDYKMKKADMLGPMAENVELWLSVEGIRQ